MKIPEAVRCEGLSEADGFSLIPARAAYSHLRAQGKSVDKHVAVQEDPQGAGGRVGPGHGQAGVERLEAVAVQVEVAGAREGRVHVLHHAGDAGPGLEQHGAATVVRLAQQPHGAGQELRVLPGRQDPVTEQAAEAGQSVRLVQHAHVGGRA